MALLAVLTLQEVHTVAVLVVLTVEAAVEAAAVEEADVEEVAVEETEPTEETDIAVKLADSMIIIIIISLLK